MAAFCPDRPTHGCRFLDPLAFEPGECDVTSSMRAALADLVPLVADRSCSLVVEGHAQTTETREPHEIAVRRALAVVLELKRLGFPRQQIVLAAIEEAPAPRTPAPRSAKKSPLIDDLTPEEIDRNQRAVEIWVYVQD